MISIKWLILFTIALCCVVGIKGRSISSSQKHDLDDSELESQLKILNKTPIKTFQVGEGQTIDCVDIYKQPAFDHHLLKNHKIQLRPSYISSSTHKSQSESIIQKVDCPQGTVPIRRTFKEDLIRAKSFAESYPVNTIAANTSTYHENVAASTYQHIAVASTPVTENKYYGIYGSLNSQNPLVLRGQSSSSQLWIENAPSATYETLQAGWMVSVELFHDFGTHFFGYWKHIASSSTDGCYNTFCIGFVQVSTAYFPGQLLSRTSHFGDTKRLAIDVSIHQDRLSGNWWLTIVDNINIGYWPKELVPSLSEGTPTVSWGGVAQVDRVSGKSPEMGNGHFPDEMRRLENGCFIGNMKVLNEQRYWEVVEDSVEKHADREQCYRIDYFGFVDPNYGKLLQFGGPGGTCN